MQRTIAVAPDLTPVARALSAQGYRVVELPRGRAAETVRADVVVVSGLSNGMEGVWRQGPQAAVIDAGGKTPDDVAAEVRAALAHA